MKPRHDADCGLLYDDGTDHCTCGASETVEVKQVDRDAAADLLQPSTSDSEAAQTFFAMMRNGAADHAASVQAFARHRTTAESASCEALREALESIADHAKVRIQDGIEIGATVWRLALEDVEREARAAIAAVAKEG